MLSFGAHIVDRFSISFKTEPTLKEKRRGEEGEKGEGARRELSNTLLTFRACLRAEETPTARKPGKMAPRATIPRYRTPRKTTPDRSSREKHERVLQVNGHRPRAEGRSHARKVPLRLQSKQPEHAVVGGAVAIEQRVEAGVLPPSSSVPVA
jgi:hypothetical protein